MKRFWHTFLAIVATATMVNTANAQFPSGEIGSYQSILSRAGYGDGSGTSAAPVQASPGAPVNFGAPAGAGCINGNCGGATSPGLGGSGTTNQGAYGQASPVPGLPPGLIPQGAGIAAPLQGSASGYAGSVEGGEVIDQGYVGNNAGAFTAPRSVPSPIINYTEPAVSQPVFSQPVVSQPVYSAPVYAQPTYQTVPVYVSGQSFESSRPRSNKVFSLFGVSLRRDYEDGVKLGYQSQGQGDFFSDDVQHGNLTGIGASLASRNHKGTGWEVRYWGLDESDVEEFGPASTSLRGLDDVFHSPASYSARFAFDNADNLRLDRTTRINSLAFNLLRNGGQYQTRRGCGNYELLAGFRLFEFDEDLQFSANSSGVPTRLEYALETENFLAGFQVGCRNEVCLGKRLRLNSGLNVGVFNNRIDTRQRIFDETGFESSLPSGRSFNFEDEKDDVAFLGEFNTGLTLPLTNRLRLNAGYKVVGVAGVALAADQIPRNFTDERALQTANSNGSLILHGFYYGAEASF